MGRQTSLLVCAVVIGLGSGCVVVGPRHRAAVIIPAPGISVTYVDRDPPPPNAEVVPEPPGGDYVWIDGYWRWDARAYVWVPGRYILRPQPRAVWVPGRWMRHERGWYWREGYWR